MKMMNEKVDIFIEKQTNWRKEYKALREIVLESNLVEDFKWSVPCYTYDNINVLIIHAFKEYIALNFFNGVLMEDKENLLVTQTKNVQETRQLRFKSIDEISSKREIIKSYIDNAIDIAKSGAKIELKETKDYEMVPEFKELLDNDETLSKAFYALTPGRQHGYLYYFSTAKQSKTRSDRITKNIPKILAGKGFQDR